MFLITPNQYTFTKHLRSHKIYIFPNNDKKVMEPHEAKIGLTVTEMNRESREVGVFLQI